MANEFQIEIKTKADLKAAEDLKRALESQATAVKKLGGDAGGLQGRIAKVDSAMRSFGAGTGSAGSALGNISGLIGGKMIAAVGGLAGAFAAAKKAIGEFAQAEEGVAKLDAALAQSGQLTDSYRERLQAIAGQLQQTTGIADDEWVGVLTKLTQFGSTSESVGMDVEAVKNLAGILGGDLNAAATMVAKAMQGNYEAFGRYGIVVGEAGTQTEKLAKIYADLAQRGGGQLEAATQTLNGQFRVLKNNVSDLFEAIGGLINSSGLLKSVMYGLSESAKWVAGILGGVIPKMEGLANSTRKTTVSAGESKSAQEGLQRTLEETKKRADETGRKFDDLSESIRLMSRQAMELEDIALAEQVANIDVLEKSGRISPAEATKARAQAQIASASRKTEIENSRDAELIRTEQSRAAQAKSEVARLEAKKQAITSAFPKVTAHEEAQSVLENKQGEFDSLVGSVDWKLHPKEAAIRMERASQLEKEMDRLRDNVVRTRSGLPRGASSSVDLSRKQQAVDAQLTDAKARESSVGESANRNISSLQQQVSFRSAIAPRRAAVEQTRANVEAVSQLNSEAKAGADGVRTSSATAAALLRQNNQLQSQAWAMLLSLYQQQNSALAGLTNDVARLKGQASNARTR